MGASASKKPPGALRGLMKQKTRFALQRARSPFFFFFLGFLFFFIFFGIKKKILFLALRACAQPRTRMEGGNQSSRKGRRLGPGGEDARLFSVRAVPLRPAGMQSLGEEDTRNQTTESEYFFVFFPDPHTPALSRIPPHFSTSSPAIC